MVFRGIIARPYVLLDCCKLTSNFPHRVCLLCGVRCVSGVKVAVDCFLAYSGCGMGGAY